MEPPQRTHPALGGEQGRKQDDQERPEIVDQIGVCRGRVLDANEIEQVISKQAGHPEGPGPCGQPELAPDLLALNGPDHER